MNYSGYSRDAEAFIAGFLTEVPKNSLETSDLPLLTILANLNPTPNLKCKQSNLLTYFLRRAIKIMKPYWKRILNEQNFFFQNSNATQLRETTFNSLAHKLGSKNEGKSRTLCTISIVHQIVKDYVDNLGQNSLQLWNIVK